MEALQNLVDTILGRLRAIERAIAASHITRRAHRHDVNQQQMHVNELQLEVNYLNEKYDDFEHKLNIISYRVDDLENIQDSDRFF